MKRMMFVLLTFSLISLSSCASVGGKSTVSVDESMTADEKLHKINLITQKLHGMHESSNDLDVLESEGLEKSDVNSIRRAIVNKIKQLTNQTVHLIDAL